MFANCEWKGLRIRNENVSESEMKMFEDVWDTVYADKYILSFEI